jgi:hypothetical protein
MFHTGTRARKINSILNNRQMRSIQALASKRSHFDSTEGRALDGKSLPAGLDDAWNLTTVSQRTEAQTADTKLAKERTRTSAKLAAVMLAAGKLGLARIFDSFCSGCHISS